MEVSKKEPSFTANDSDLADSDGWLSNSVSVALCDQNMLYWLVVWNMFFLFSISSNDILGMS